jgi:hypothetical protein
VGVSRTRLWRFIAHGSGQLMRVIRSHPPLECSAQRASAGPVLPPPARRCEGIDAPRRVSMAFGVVIAGTGVPHPQRAAGLHTGRSSRLAAVVAHQRTRWPPRALRQWPSDRPSQSRPPWLRRAWRARLGADALVRLPRPHAHHVNPADACHPHLGQGHAPPLLGLGRSGLARLRRPLGLQLQVGRDSQGVGSPQAQHALLMAHAGLDDAQIRPEAPSPPAWGRGLQPLARRQQGVIPLADLPRAAPLQPSPSSLLLHSRSHAPTRVFRLACARARRVSFRVCGWRSQG